MYTIMVSGGIGTGKSYAARYLAKKYNAAYINLDEVAKELMYPGSELVAQVAQAYGEDILDENGAIIRPLLAARAFETAEATRALDALTIPAIEAYLTDYLIAPYCAAIRPACCVIEYPLLAMHPELAHFANKILVIKAPTHERVKRLVVRGMDEADALRRIELQPSDGDYECYAHFSILNDETLEAFEGRLERWFDRHIAPRIAAAQKNAQ